ncbi:UDP-N-acetyl-D-mannosamine dehydrogenase [Falsiroseomonas sp.]|uniref:UDP-N-acetyl-D-mannosamine dehydrogenase n=1 Tax=Falsiroseomonas sp. TaxID=2870721 RepID=UPI0035648587
MSDVCVVGLGHVGLPTAALLAEAGHRVVGCDTAPEVVARVNAGRAGLHEPGLDALLARAGERLRAQAVPAAAEFHLITVPTPLGEVRRADLSHVWAAADAVAPVLRAGDCVILESTVPVGTTERLAARLAGRRPDLVFPAHGGPSLPGCVHVAHCPERVMPGRALHELVHNDRVIGGLGAGCAARAAEVYRGFVRGAPVLADCRMAELVKLAENAFRDVNIAFANELAAVCGRFGLDVWQAIGLANRHPRVNVLSPGAGVGGHCVAVDPWFLVEGAPEEARLVRAAREVNDATPHRVVAQLRQAAARFAAPRVACLGLAYKPDVGDLRESPAVVIAEALLREGMAVSVCDPFVARLPDAVVGAVLRDPAAAIAEADVVAILVAHTAFRGLDRALFGGKAVVDAVGLLRG